MTTLTSRKAARQHLATLLTAITELQTVYDHQTKDIKRESPVCMVYSDGSQTFWPGYAYEHHRAWIELFVRRDDDDACEDLIDDLSQKVRQKLLDNYEVSAKWADLRFDESPSEMGYVVIDGKMYRTERFAVTVVSVCDNT